MFNPALFWLVCRPSDPPVVDHTPLPPVGPMREVSPEVMRQSMMLTNQILNDLKGILGK